VDRGFLDALDTRPGEKRSKRARAFRNTIKVPPHRRHDHVCDHNRTVRPQFALTRFQVTSALRYSTLLFIAFGHCHRDRLMAVALTAFYSGGSPTSQLSIRPQRGSRSQSRSV